MFAYLAKYKPQAPYVIVSSKPDEDNRDESNWTPVTNFILLGLSDSPTQQAGLFSLFLTMYFVAVLGNGRIVAIIIRDRHLHTPMYFFLGNLSFVDICFTSAIAPKMLQNMLAEVRTISFEGCMAQLYAFCFTATTEIYLLAIMGFDRYFAICNPLRYTYVMSRVLCISLVSGSWLFVSLHSLLHISMVSRFDFCGSNLIQHFFCDLPPLLKLACSDTTTYEWLVFTEGSVVSMSPFVLAVASYVAIISTILKIPSEERRLRAFSTCSSHLTVVTLFFGTIFFTYFRPFSANTLDQGRMVTVMYTIVTPMLNPFNYSLRNNDVKGALRNAFNRKISV
ncbi:olfactory receptor 1E16-like [Pleurodeles waltl]|uniref:olfactory receptor 1E16-like n=1 Tax=Pleurodeles waltl TaxID=8319 RepID=UPI0037094B4B